jgi:hypothetical protein
MTRTRQPVRVTANAETIKISKAFLRFKLNSSLKVRKNILKVCAAFYLIRPKFVTGFAP